MATNQETTEAPHPRMVVHSGVRRDFVAAGMMCIPGTRQWQAVSVRIRDGKVIATVPLGEPEDLPWSLARAQESLMEGAAAAQQVAFPPNAEVMLATLPAVTP